jgi:hypothetical protein
MAKEYDSILIFNQSPVVEIATNRFVNVPVILQYEVTPLIEVVKEVHAGFTIQIPIYHSDGTYLAKIKGSQIYLTDAGKKVGVALRHPAGMTVCEIAGKPVFEIIRKEAAAIKTQAELYTPDASFIKCSDSGMAGYILGKDNTHLTIRGVTMMDCDFRNSRIGIHVRKDGSVGIGCS